MGLTEAALKMIFWLFLAGLLGWIVGFLLGRILGSANATALLNDCEGKMRMRDLELNGLRSDLTAAQAKISSLETERSTLVVTLKTRENWVTEMEVKNNDLEADLDARISELDELKVESDRAQADLNVQLEAARAEIARLKVRITDLEMMVREVKEPMVKVSHASALPPSDKERDDLKQIFGIGPGLENLLNAHGIYWFRQIAEWSAEDVQHYDKLLEDFHGRIVRDDWIGSARKEHHKKYGEQL